MGVLHLLGFGVDGGLGVTGGLGVWLCLASAVWCFPSEPTGSGLILLTDLFASALLGDLVLDLDRSEISNKPN